MLNLISVDTLYQSSFQLTLLASHSDQLFAMTGLVQVALFPFFVVYGGLIAGYGVSTAAVAIGLGAYADLAGLAGALIGAFKGFAALGVLRDKRHADWQIRRKEGKHDLLGISRFGMDLFWIAAFIVCDCFLQIGLALGLGGTGLFVGLTMFGYAGAFLAGIIGLVLGWMIGKFLLDSLFEIRDPNDHGPPPNRPRGY